MSAPKRDFEVMKAFGKKIAELRQSKGLSQYKLSYISDVSREQIKRIEKGESNSTISVIVALAKALGVEAKDLLDF